MLLNLSKYFILLARRDYIFTGLIVSIIGCFFLSMFFGWTSIDEIKQMQIVYYASSVRLVLSFGTVVFICFFIRRFIDNKEIELVLSYPISRLKLISAILLSFSAMATVLVVIASLFMLYYIKDISLTGYFVWAFSLCIELVLLSCFAVFFSVSMVNAPISIFFTLAFYLLSRSMGFIVSAISLDPTTFHYSSILLISKIATKMAFIIGAFFPRLDLFSQSSWLVYGIDSYTFGLCYLQGLIYIGVISFATITDFKRKSL